LERKYEYICEMDCDFSHPVDQLPNLIAKCEAGADDEHGDEHGDSREKSLTYAPAVYADVLRLLRLADRSGQWPSTSLARARILSVEDPQQQEMLARLAMRGGWTVRQLEAAIAKKDPAAPSLAVDPRTALASVPVPVDPHLTDLENRIRDRVGLRIALHYKGGKGRLDVQFNSNDELDHLLEVLGVTVD
jgi:hypothetical protein